MLEGVPVGGGSVHINKKKVFDFGQTLFSPVPRGTIL